jgi:hypothetical protein
MVGPLCCQFYTKEPWNILGDVKLKEIRLAWSISGRMSIIFVPINAGLWHPDNVENRANLEIIAEAGNFAYGEGTHWIEEREA